MAFGTQGNYGRYLGYEVEGAWCNSDGVQLHYTDQGAGVPVILMHGYAMTTDITWRGNGTIDFLSQDYRVITLDLRGHGLSDKPRGDDDYGVEMARDVVRLMDCLGIPRAHVVGNSLGGLVAIKTATMFPDRVLSLTACGMGWARYEDKQQVVEDLANAIAAEGGIRPLVQYLRPPDAPMNSLALAALNTFILSFNDAQALAAMTRQMPELEVTEEQLRNLPMPVLNIAGSRDPLLPDVFKMEALVPNPRLAVVEGADHFNLAGQPETRAALSAFLAAIPTEQSLPVGS